MRTPVEPPASAWSFGDPTDYDPLDDLVAIGADLEPGTLLAAYRRGLFPMPSGTPGDPAYWFCPVRRGVLPLDGLVVSRSLRRALRDFEIRVDTAFDEVVAGCADPTRESGWIDHDIRRAYRRLHELGWAHSVEAWQDGRLVGGLYGVALGGLFAGESMFHRVRDASKVALVGLVGLLRDEHAGDRVLDVQWQTPHLASLGVVEISRTAYLRRLGRALEVPTPAGFARPGPAGG
ncbi:leucyl/phenylalanyl-tRNA--protein transferase [Nocardioides panaciterrulae]|uniref:Leucyl/phenylalanyl-tRNA--protein transferase n=1 Tax=Nocardioides panaciterrulae TaxID=661492 RepID=A0A7Y9EA23_9ACTN|nr:leucyl/phenylalanyl-tRNA--protein transferase [Nocardioides panaciterrulae]